ncbi:MAG: molecular chaperone DnaJ [Acidimicrobiia bacterium]
MAPQREWFEKDYYEVLGVASDASQKDVTRAYRKLAKQYHPDANPGDKAAEEKFKEISAAHDVLGDAEKRKEYDDVRKMVASGMGPGGPGGFGGGFPGGGNVRFEDLGDLGDLGGIFGNLFGGGGGGGGGFGGRRGRRGGPVGPQRGHDIETELYLDFLEAVHGVTTGVGITSEAPCSVCNGSGAKPGTVPDTCATCNGAGSVAVDQGPFSFSQVCPTCGGRGAIVKDKCKHCKGRGVEVRPRTVKVRIPAGVDDGQRIRVKGRGTPGTNGGPAGDLYVIVHVQPHAVFARSGKWDLTVKVPITFPEAALGAQVKVPTLDAPVTVKVAPGTQSGKTVRVRGKGIPRANGDDGALLVTFDVVVPSHLDDDERALVEQLGDKLSSGVREHLGV